MPPVPCAHCGVNFMRPLPDADVPKLCNTCLLRDQKTVPRKEENMDTVEILIKCPRKDQIEIEELCVNQGIDFSRYFLELHYGSQAAIEEMKTLTENHRPMIHLKDDDVKMEMKPSKKGGKK